MVHYAFINNQNFVAEIIEGIDPTETQTDIDGTIVGGSVEAWQTFYQNQSWQNYDLCKLCDDNVGIGWAYDPATEQFIPPTPAPDNE